MEDAGSLFWNSLTEYYHSLVNHLPGIAVGIIIIALGYLLASWITGLVRQQLQGRVKDQIAARFLSGTAKGLLIIGAVMLGLEAAGLGSIATGLFTALGASGLIVGFAFKDIGENFLAGMILAFSRPFNVGDAIEIDGYFGHVQKLAFRYNPPQNLRWQGRLRT